METVWKFLERALTSILISLLLAILSFSFFTGKFPPSKADMVQAYSLTQEMIGKTPQINALAKDLQSAQAQGGAPSLEQMAEFQRLSLRRTEVSIELMKLFSKFQMGVPDQELADRLQKLSKQTAELEKEFAEVTVLVQKKMIPSSTSQ